ncbi:hypothetical protein FXO38_02067 [Capsicum annuum]|nr:hypothetical protein FXO37_04683 [Capsicum annuum]KAF3680858.1 hypothetical protein FXO38_02067 [Capsicum annuum]
MGRHNYNKGEAQYCYDHYTEHCSSDPKIADIVGFLGLINKLCLCAKFLFYKKKDFEYTPTFTVDITRLETMQEMKKKKKKKKAWVGISLVIDLETLDNSANQPAPTTIAPTSPNSSISLSSQPSIPSAPDPYLSTTLGTLRPLWTQEDIILMGQLVCSSDMRSFRLKVKMSQIFVDAVKASIVRRIMI